jgi:hypothetical protein
VAVTDGPLVLRDALADEIDPVDVHQAARAALEHQEELVHAARIGERDRLVW